MRKAAMLVLIALLATAMVFAQNPASTNSVPIIALNAVSSERNGNASIAGRYIQSDCGSPANGVPLN